MSSDYDPDRPFTTADAGDSSRIAEAVAQARKDKSRPQLPANSKIKTGGLHQAYRGAAAIMQHVETRMAAHPAFVLDAARGTVSIARLRFVIVSQALVLILIAATLVFSLDQKKRQRRLCGH